MLLQLERCGLKVEVDPETSQGFFIAIRCPMGSEARVSEHVGRNFFGRPVARQAGQNYVTYPTQGIFWSGRLLSARSGHNAPIKKGFFGPLDRRRLLPKFVDLPDALPDGLAEDLPVAGVREHVGQLIRRFYLLKRLLAHPGRLGCSGRSRRCARTSTP
jgi:hypothetical protein